MPLYYTAHARVRETAVTSSPFSFRGSYLVNQAKFSSAVIATTIFTAKASHTQNMIFDHSLPLSNKKNQNWSWTESRGMVINHQL